MTSDVRIRPSRPKDRAHAEALWKRVGPYRPGDEAEVDAMHARARQAREAGDIRWTSQSTPAAENEEESAVAGWVAVVATDAGAERVVGLVDVGMGEVLQLAQSMPLAQEWHGRSDIAQLDRLGVDSEFWRQGLGTRLALAAIGWCRDRGFNSLVVNTTPPQKPALSLYRKLGFRERGISFLDRYELVWLELTL